MCSCRIEKQPHRMSRCPAAHCYGGSIPTAGIWGRSERLPQAQVISHHQQGTNADRRCLLHSQAMQLSTANMAILKNMSDLMTREVWGAYEDSYKKRVLQLKKVR